MALAEVFMLLNSISLGESEFVKLRRNELIENLAFSKQDDPLFKCALLIDYILNTLVSGFGVYVIYPYEMVLWLNCSLYSAQIFQSQSPSRPQHLPLRTLTTGARQLLATLQVLTVISQPISRSKVL